MSVLMRDIPPDQRPRQRLAAVGAHRLAARELLALVLRQGTRHESALDLGDTLLREFRSVHALAHARPEELTRVAGVSPPKAAALVAAFQLGRLALEAPGEEVTLLSPADVVRVARPLLAGQPREHVLVVVCDVQHRVRHTEVVSSGGVRHSPFSVRETLNCVLRHDGYAFAVVHNHPSGSADPSNADRRLTYLLGEAAQWVGLIFLDHIVISDDDWQCVDPLHPGQRDDEDDRAVASSTSPSHRTAGQPP